MLPFECCKSKDYLFENCYAVNKICLWHIFSRNRSNCVTRTRSATTKNNTQMLPFECCKSKDYLFENCGALRAALRPY